MMKIRTGLWRLIVPMLLLRLWRAASLKKNALKTYTCVQSRSTSQAILSVSPNYSSLTEKQLYMTHNKIIALFVSLTLFAGADLALAHEAGEAGHDHGAMAMHDHHHTGDGVGKPGKVGKNTRIVTIEMADSMRFTPADIAVKLGETIHFVVKNSGQLKHEMVLGTLAELQEHAELMNKFPNMEHSEPNMLTLAPGALGDIVWTFTKAGKVNFACSQPGHFDAGMKGVVDVKK